MERHADDRAERIEQLKKRRASKRAWQARLSSLFLCSEFDDGKVIDLICEGQGEEHTWASGKEGRIRCKRCGAVFADPELDLELSVPLWKGLRGDEEGE